ncbi:MAG: hypothetical protein ACLUI5_05070, partial [Fusicatenibacter saccharivorans]
CGIRHLPGAACLVHFIQIRSAPGRNLIPLPAGINLIPVWRRRFVVNGQVQIKGKLSAENMLVFLPFGLCISALLSRQRNPEPHSPCIGTEPVF